MSAGQKMKPDGSDIVNEVQALRLLILQHAEEIAALRAETKRLRNEAAKHSPRHLTAEEMSFAREMGTGLHNQSRRRSLSRAS
ncbi:MAG: hypothetical protein RL735_1807 [Pseudomonadota bacterium]|jgi:hypothetical protein